MRVSGSAGQRGVLARKQAASAAGAGGALRHRAEVSPPFLEQNSLVQAVRSGDARLHVVHMGVNEAGQDDVALLG